MPICESDLHGIEFLELISHGCMHLLNKNTRTTNNYMIVRFTETLISQAVPKFGS